MFFIFLILIFVFCIAAFGPAGIIVAIIFAALGAMAAFAGGD